MMDIPTNINEYKERKKLELITKDLEQLNKLLTLTTKSLLLYKKYRPIQDVLTSIQDNTKILRIHYEKIKGILDNGKLETITKKDSSEGSDR